jgi:hypothetical protein
MAAWQGLHSQFGVTNGAQAMLLSQQLHQLRQKDKESMQQYAERVQGCWLKLNAIEGHSFPEAQAVGFMVNGLQPRMTAMAAAVLQRYLEPGAPTATFDAVLTSLLYHEQTMNQQQQHADTGSALLSQATHWGGRGSSNYGGRGGRGGSSNGDQGSSTGSRGVPRDGKGCYLCGGSHFIRDCPQLAAAKAAASTGAAKQQPSSNLALIAKVAVKWVVDSGATQHMCNNREAFSNYQPVTGVTVKVGNGEVVAALGQGSVELYISQGQTVTLSDVLHVEAAPMNLLSVGQAQDKGVDVSFHDGVCTFKLEGKVVLTAKRVNRLYYLEA